MFLATHTNTAKDSVEKELEALGCGAVKSLRSRSGWLFGVTSIFEIQSFITNFTENGVFGNFSEALQFTGLNSLLRSSVPGAHVDRSNSVGRQQHDLVKCPVVLQRVGTKDEPILIAHVGFDQM